MANIKHIAKLANVSISTVSRVLNNQPYVSEDKKESYIRCHRAIGIYQKYECYSFN